MRFMKRNYTKILLRNLNRRLFFTILGSVMFVDEVYSQNVGNYYERSVTFATYSAQPEERQGTFIASGNDLGVVITKADFFRYGGVSYNRIRVNVNGVIEFVDNSVITPPTDPMRINPGTVNKNLIAPWWDDLYASGGDSRIDTVTLGTAPNRIFIVDYRNIIAYSESNVNFKVFFYEKNNAIKIAYGGKKGTTYSTATDVGATVGLLDNGGHYLRGHPVEIRTRKDDYLASTEFPEEGTEVLFIPQILVYHNSNTGLVKDPLGFGSFSFDDVQGVGVSNNSVTVKQYSSAPSSSSITNDLLPTQYATGYVKAVYYRIISDTGLKFTSFKPNDLGSVIGAARLRWIRRSIEGHAWEDLGGEVYSGGGMQGVRATKSTSLLGDFALVELPGVSTIVANRTGDWEDRATWQGGVVPNERDSVSITDGVEVTMNEDHVIDKLELNSSGRISLNGKRLTLSNISSSGGTFVPSEGSTVAFATGNSVAIPKFIRVLHHLDLTGVIGTGKVSHANELAVIGTITGATATNFFPTRDSLWYSGDNVEYLKGRLVTSTSYSIAARLAGKDFSRKISTGSAWIEFAQDQLFTVGRINEYGVTAATISATQKDSIRQTLSIVSSRQYYARLNVKFNISRVNPGVNTDFIVKYSASSPFPNSILRRSIKDGFWSDPQTWEGGIVPGSGDSVGIYHNVTISGATAVRSVTLFANTLSLGSSLRVTGSILQGVGGTGKFETTSGSILILDSKREMVLPASIRRVHRLAIVGGQNVGLSGGLVVVDSLRITGNGKLLRRGVGNYVLVQKATSIVGAANINPPLNFDSTEALSARSFGASGAYASTTADYMSSVLSNISTNFTVEAWIKATSWNTIIKNGTILSAAGFNSGFGLYAGGTNKGVLFVVNGQELSTGDRFEMLENQWYHVAGVYNGTSMMIYINGVLVTEASANGVVLSSGSRFSIGSNSVTSTSFFGLLDEVRLWETARTRDMIVTAMDSVVAYSHPNLLLQYRMDENILTKLIDQSVNAKHVSIVGSIPLVVSGARITKEKVTGYTTVHNGNPNNTVDIGTRHFKVLKPNPGDTLKISQLSSINSQYAKSGNVDLKSVNTGDGYLVVKRKSQNAPNLEEFTFHHVATAKFSTFIIRYGATDAWDIVTTQAAAGGIECKVSIGNRAYFELAIGILRSKLRNTVNNGTWNETNTAMWQDGILPLSGDTVVINHNVRYSNRTELPLKVLRLMSGARLTIAERSTLFVQDSVDFQLGARSIDSVGRYSKLIIQPSKTKGFRIPDSLRTVRNLEVRAGAGPVYVNNDLMVVDSVILKAGGFLDFNNGRMWLGKGLENLGGTVSPSLPVVIYRNREYISQDSAKLTAKFNRFSNVVSTKATLNIEFATNADFTQNIIRSTKRVSFDHDTLVHKFRGIRGYFYYARLKVKLGRDSIVYPYWDNFVEIPASILSTQSGDWYDKKTWLTNTIPSSGESAIVRHKVTVLPSPKEPRVQDLTLSVDSLIVYDTLTVSGTLAQTGGFLVTKKHSSKRLGGALRVQKTETDDFYLPSGVNKLHVLMIGGNGGVQLQGDLALLDSLIAGNATNNKLRRSDATGRTHQVWYGKDTLSTTLNIADPPVPKVAYSNLRFTSATSIAQTAKLSGYNFEPANLYLVFSEDRAFTKGVLSGFGKPLISKMRDSVRQEITGLINRKSYFRRMHAEVFGSTIPYVATKDSVFVRTVRRSVRSGNWSNFETWENGVMPLSTDTVEVGYDVTILQSTQVGKLLLGRTPQNNTNAATLTLQAGVQLTVLDSLNSFSNGFSISAGTSSALILKNVNSNGRNLKLPVGIQNLDNLIIDFSNRTDTLFIENNLTLNQTLSILRGTVYLKGNVSLTIGGELVISNQGNFGGTTWRTTSDKGYELIIANDARARFSLSESIKTLNRLIIRRRQGAIINSDLVVLDELSVGNTNYSDVTLERGSFGVFSRYFTSVNGGRINPNVVFESKYAGKAYASKSPFSVPDLAPGSIGSNITVEAWIKINEWKDGAVVAKHRSSSSDGFLLSLSDGGVLSWSVGFGASTALLRSSVQLNLSKWYHVAAIFESTGAGVLRLFVDGVEVGNLSANNNNNISYQNGSLEIRDIQGNIEVDEFRFWSEVRSVTDLRAFRETQLMGTENNLQVYYRFDEGEGNAIYDFTSKKRHAKGLQSLSWVQSKAIIGVLSPSPVATIDNVVPNRENYKTEFSSLVRGFNIIASGTNGTQADIISLSVLEGFPNYELEPQGIDSAYKSLGRWWIMKSDQNQTISDVQFEVPLEGVKLTEFPNTDRLVWLYRYSPSDSLRSLGGHIVEVGGKAYLRSSFVLNRLNGMLELAIGVRNSVSRSVSNGNWTSPSTWQSRSVPTVGDDTVKVQNMVNLDYNTSVRTLKVNGGSVLNVLSNTLTLVGSLIIDPNGRLIGNHGTSGYRIVVGENEATAKMKWSENLKHVNHLTVERKSGVEVLDSLTLSGQLRITSGRVYLPIEASKLTLLSSAFFGVDTAVVTSLNSEVIISESVTNSASVFEMPILTRLLDNLVVNRAQGVQLNSDLIVRNRTRIINGKIYKGINGFVSRNYLLNSANISITSVIEPIKLDSVAAGKAVSFSGVGSGGISVVPASSFVLGNKTDILFSAEAWIYPTKLPGAYAKSVIMSHYDGSSGWSLYIKDDSTLALVLGSQTRINVYEQTNFKLKEKTWFFVTVSVGESLVKIFVDGVEVLSMLKVLPVFQAPNVQPIQIGSFNGGSPFVGMVDELRIWSEGRVGSQIRNQMNSQINGKESNLILYFRMDEGIGTVVYDYSSNGLVGSFTSSNMQEFKFSNAPIGEFSPPPVSNSEYRVTAGVNQFLPSLTTDISNSVKLRLIATTSNSGNVRIAFHDGWPFPVGNKPVGVDTIRGDIGHWKILTTSDNFSLSGLGLSLQMNSITTEKLEDRKRYVFLVRTSPGAPWIIQNTELRGPVSADTLISINRVSLNGYLEVVLAQRKELRVYNIPPIFGENETDVTVGVRLVGYVSGISYEAEFTVSTNKNFDGTDLIQTPYRRMSSDGTIRYELKNSGLVAEKDYFVKSTVRVGGVDGALIPISFVNIFSTKGRNVESQPDTKETRILEGVSPRSGALIASLNGYLDSLRVTYVKADPTIISTTRYSTKPSGESQISDSYSALPKSYYWSIQSNLNEITEARLYYPLSKIINDPVEPEDIISDTTNLMWLKRESSSEPWTDVTDENTPIVTLNGQRMLRTKAVSNFSEFVIVHKTTTPKVQTYKFVNVLFPRVDYTRDSIVAKISPRINTGFEPTTVSVLISESINGLKDNPKEVRINEPIRRTPLLTDTTIYTKKLLVDKTYFYKTNLSNKKGTTSGITGWFYTMFPAKSGIDTLPRGLFSVSKNTSIHVQDLEFEIDVTEAEGTSRGFPVNTNYYLKRPTLGGSLPSNIKDFISMFWSVVPMTSMDGRLVPNTYVTYPNTVGKINIKEKSVLLMLPATQFPKGTDFTYLKWLRRKDKDSEWEDLGSQIIEFNGRSYLSATKQISEVIGEYTLGSIITTEPSMTFEKLSVQNIGGGKARISFVVTEEKDNLGMEIVAIHNGEERIVSNFITHPSYMSGNGTVTNRKRTVFAVAENLAYGETYFFRIRSYDRYGNTHDYDANDYSKFAKITMPTSETYDPVFYNKVEQNYPNPFSSSTTFVIQLKEDQNITINIYDIIGRRVATVLNNVLLRRGKNEIVFTPQNVSSGVYLYEVKGASVREVKRMVYMR
ncbi:hypothetical protein CHS0354_000764 [Potamilus streckersoni]|uniref:LamG-like jellyroll fold domain-containing protein n=1 Tax=Potamilus streckersoni TaxID=2493646 RepID=A0AAE0T778_9BIVA|nr:hypothetical protein CHS0354_000764 [Potamilus streckersoni]